MTDFRKEDRYSVFKVTDLQKAVALYPEREAEIKNALATLSVVTHNARIIANKKPFYCVCVEDDWRCYEEVWAMVEKEHNENNV